MNDKNESPMNNIYKSCLTARNQNAHLLLGHKGCGKSTELNMLKLRFEKSGRMVSIIQCVIEADILGVAYWDLLILLGQHLCNIAEDMGCALPDSLLDDISGFWKDIEIVDTQKNDYGLGIKGGVSAETPKFVKIIKFFASLSSEIKYGYDKRTTIRDKVRKSTAQWIGYLREVADYISQQSGGYQPIIIFEDLDKLPPDKAWEIFDNNALSQMPFPVIYTFPISLSYDPKFARLEATFSNNHIHILPMIKIRTIDGIECQSGVDSIRCIVEKRTDLSIFEPSVLEFMISKTGGILRDLFYCISQAANRAGNRQMQTIGLEDAHAVTTRLRSSLTRRIEIKNYPLLINISKGSKYKSQIEDREMLLEMMLGLIVLEYNGERWHDLHPLIEDFLREQGELQ
jgi:energy-coupling factor transporter ATP-binding protein EcfA2